jgi:murein DD-endopeptidase MepM/ murein hydrolase activator NlpD
MTLNSKHRNFNGHTSPCYLCRMAKRHRNRAANILATLIFLAATASAASAQQCSVKPATIPLGETVRLQCKSVTGGGDASSGSGAANNAVATARLKDRSVKMFKQKDGTWFGLMPIAVADIPGAYSVEFLAAGGETIDAAKLTIRPTKFPMQNVNLAPQIEELKSSPEEIQTLAAFRSTVSDEKFWDDPLVAPVTGCVLSSFGVKRLHNGKPTGEFHGGVDQRAAAGSPIHAAAAGEVKLAQLFTVLGGAVGIDHGQGLETMYLHMSKIAVQPGARVNKGDVIGYVGATGRANGPHLHWLIDVNGVPVNPRQWVTLATCGTTPSKSVPAQKH